MGGLIYLIVFSALFYGLHHAGKWMGLKLVQLSPRKKWAFKLVNYPKWKIMLSGCLLFVFLTCGDEIYSKFRIELMCHDAKKTLPVIDKTRISNKKIIAIHYKDQLLPNQIIKDITISSVKYYDADTNQFLFENRGFYGFSSGWLTSVLKNILFSNVPIKSIPYPEGGSYCSNTSSELNQINLNELNSSIVDRIYYFSQES